MTIILEVDRHFGQICQIDKTVEYYLVQVHFQVILARQAADLNFNITNPHFISFKFIQREEVKCVVQKLETLRKRKMGENYKNVGRTLIFEKSSVYPEQSYPTTHLHPPSDN